MILFSLDIASRGKYQTLFQQRAVHKIYHALAPSLPELIFPITRCTRMVESKQFFVMEEVDGQPNAETRIDVIEKRGAISLYELQPTTGKKHQLRLHLANLGAPIVNDMFYPVALPCKGDDFSAPLQLLAKSIAFDDPISGERRLFDSQRSL